MYFSSVFYFTNFSLKDKSTFALFFPRVYDEKNINYFNVK